MKALKMELYRAFRSKTFFVSLMIGNVICLLDLFTFCCQFGLNINKYLIQSWVGTDYQFAYNQMFFILLPVLACLPYGGSLYTDIKSGYDKNICVKASRLNYLFAKCSAVFLSAFTSVTLPLGLNMFIASGLFPNDIPERLEWMSAGLMDRNLFGVIYSYYPAIYCLIYILIDGLFAGAIALTSLSIARIINSHFTAVVMPMVVVVITSIMMQGDEKGNWSILEMINPGQNVTTLWYQMLIVYLVILIVNVAVITITSKKRDIL